MPATGRKRASAGPVDNPRDGATQTETKSSEAALPRASFIEALRRSGNVAASAGKAVWSPCSAYSLRRKNGRFAAEWAGAAVVPAELLEAEAHRRAVDGVEQPIIHSGRVVEGRDGTALTVRRYSDRLLEFLLRTRRSDPSRPAPAPEQDGDAADDEELARSVLALLNEAAQRKGGEGTQ